MTQQLNADGSLYDPRQPTAGGNTGNNSTGYDHPQETNLLNLHKAMEYREDGKPALRVITTFDGNIIIEGSVTIPGTVTVNSSPEDPVHTHITEVGTSGILAVPYMPIQGNVTATITDVITVIAEEDPGELYAFNNHATNTNRGWTMDEVMRPVVSFQNGSADAADIIKIVEYEIGNNNANQSTIVYEWYEGPLTISGAAIPAWTTFGVHSQYRVYQDRYQSNTGNTFTVPAGTYQRHSGIIIGKNTSGDEGPANLHGGGSPNMLTLCMRRVDNATKLDVWFAFTVKELT
jgi:hypothetical protein